MANKSTGRGLLKSDIKGADDLFGQEAEPQEETKKSGAVAQKEVAPAKNTQQEKLRKTSVNLSVEAQELLFDLKRVARRTEGRFVSQGEILERGLKELAEKYELVTKG
jgi:hypothetical protein